MRRLLIALVVLLGLLVAADRIGAVVAERVMASQIRDQLELQETPDVGIRGVPFLTQAVRGRYSDVRVTLPDVDSGRLQDMVVDARLQGVRVPLGDVLDRQVEEVPVDRITGNVTVGYDQLARASGISGLRIARDGDAVTLSGSVEVLGRQVEASATGRVEVNGDDLVISADRAEVAGVEVPDVALDAAARLLSFQVSPSRLPLSLRITGVEVTDTGLQVSAVSDDAVLRPEDVPVN